MYSAATKLTEAPCTVALIPAGTSHVKVNVSWSASLEAEASTTTTSPAFASEGAVTTATGAVLIGPVSLGLPLQQRCRRM